MAVKTYSIKNEGSQQISPNFKVSEFACSDGSDTVLIDDKLVSALQKIRDYFGQSVTINSAYRTEAHNKKIGGATNSQHTKGTAADIVVKGVAPLDVARYADSVGIGGVGHYPSGQGNFTHIDVRAAKYRWEQKNGREVAVRGFDGQAVPDYITIVQQKAGLDNSTMAYLQQYKYGEDLLRKLAGAMK